MIRRLLVVLAASAAALVLVASVNAAAIARGTLVPLNNERASGVVALVRLTNGKLVVRVTKSDIAPGPALRVYLVAGAVATNADVTRFKDLGPLKATTGSHTYSVPRGTNTKQFRTLVIWCADFSVAFGKAVLKPV